MTSYCLHIYKRRTLTNYIIEVQQQHFKYILTYINFRLYTVSAFSESNIPKHCEAVISMSSVGVLSTRIFISVW